jgi:hypothetical protein
MGPEARALGLHGRLDLQATLNTDQALKLQDPDCPSTRLTPAALVIRPALWNQASKLVPMDMAPGSTSPLLALVATGFRLTSVD